MSRDYSDKLKAIRNAEGLTQKQFSVMTGLSLGTVKNYESKQHDAKALTVEKILEVEEFQKYTLWLMIDKTKPEAGQIAPTAAHEEKSMEINEKMRAIRVAEGFSLSQLSKLLNLPEKMIQEYESGTLKLDGATMLKYTNHPRFEKYTLWLMSDQTFPASGQVAPVILQEGKYKIHVNN